jgi:hypothetical protein
MKDVKELRARLERERRASAGKARFRFSAESKRWVAQYVTDARSRGVSDCSILRELGIGPASLHRWCGPRSKAKASAFRQVATVRARKAAESLVPVVLTPAGAMSRGIPIAIVGLSAGELVELCWRLGC